MKFCEISTAVHCRIDRYYIGQIYGGDFAKMCGLLRIYELYTLPNGHLKELDIEMDCSENC